MPPQVGYMLQKDLLFPWRTALANVTLGLEIKGMARADARQRAHVLLDQLGLHGFSGLLGTLRRSTGPLSQSADVPSLLKENERQDRQPEEGGDAQNGAELKP